MEKKHLLTSAQKIYRSARYAILALILLTILNVLLDLLNRETYIVSTVFISFNLHAVSAYLLAALSLVPYMLCFLFSKKHPAWLIVALVLVSIDTFALLCMALFNFFLLLVMIEDVLFHILVIVLLSLGIKNGKAAMAADSFYHEG